jgi:hypothetical protein
VNKIIQIAELFDLAVMRIEGWQVSKRSINKETSTSTILFSQINQPWGQ